MNEAGFLRAILADPKDDAALLLYADWLAEQSDPTSIDKAEFLRLTVGASAGPVDKGGKKSRPKRLRELAASLDTDWLAVVSRLPVENCLVKRTEGEILPRPSVFQYLCERRWEDLHPTEPGVRFCATCEMSVHYCDTIGAARRRAEEGRCIAVDLGIIRREDDLRPVRTGMMLGRVSLEQLRHEQERLLPDRVSAQRELRKQEAAANTATQK